MFVRCFQRVRDGLAEWLRQRWTTVNRLPHTLVAEVSTCLSVEIFTNTRTQSNTGDQTEVSVPRPRKFPHVDCRDQTNNLPISRWPPLPPPTTESSWASCGFVVVNSLTKSLLSVVLGCWHFDSVDFINSCNAIPVSLLLCPPRCAPDWSLPDHENGERGGMCLIEPDLSSFSRQGDFEYDGEKTSALC